MGYRIVGSRQPGEHNYRSPFAWRCGCYVQKSPRPASDRGSASTCPIIIGAPKIDENRLRSNQNPEHRAFRTHVGRASPNRFGQHCLQPSEVCEFRADVGKVKARNLLHLRA